MNIQIEHNLGNKNSFGNIIHPILLPTSISQDFGNPEKKRMILGFSKYCQRKDTAFPSEVFDDLLKYQDLAIDALVLALMTGSNHTRAMAAFALKKYKTPQVVTILIEASNDQFEEVRIWAVKSLGEIGDKRGLRPLLKRLNDKSDVVRTEAACALGKLNDIRVYEYLIEALKDTNENVRLAAFSSLVQLHQFQLSEILKVDIEDQEAKLSSITYPDNIPGFADIECIIERYKQPPEPAIALAVTDNLTNQTTVTEEIKIEDKNPNLPAIYHPGNLLAINDVRHFIDQHKQPIETTIIPAVTDDLTLEPTDAILVKENPSDLSKTLDDIPPEQSPVTPYAGVGESGIETPADDESFTNNAIAEKLQDMAIEMVELNEDFNVASDLICNISPIDLDRVDSITDIKNSQIDFVEDSIVENAVILKAIANGNEVVRGIALLLLPREYTMQTNDFILKALKDDSLFVRSTAVWLLGEINNKRGAEALLPLMRDETTEIREEAKSAYAKIRDPRVIEAMMSFYRENNLDSAEKGLSSELTTRGVGIENVLIPFLHDSNVALRAWATWALGEGRAVNAVTHLIDALNDKSKEVQTEAIHALVKIGDPAINLLIEALNDKHRDVQAGVAVTLISLGEPAIGPAIQAFKHKDTNGHQLISTILTFIGKRAIPPLIQALGDDSEQVREHAIQTLGQFGADAFEPLMQTLTSDNERVHFGAIRALSFIGDTRAIEPLIPFLKHSNSTIRLQTVNVLSGLNDPKIVPSLIPLLFDKNEDIRLATVKALGKLRDPQTILPLIKKLKDTSRNVQLEVANALSSIGEAIPD